MSEHGLDYPPGSVQQSGMDLISTEWVGKGRDGKGRERKGLGWDGIGKEGIGCRVGKWMKAN
eukprot:scaffold72333_cov14-Prasinocladus_malaysianus.AAC.1